MKLIEVLRGLVNWPKVPKKVPAIQPACLGCGCTDSAACEGGCSWHAIDADGRWGVCTACCDRNLCPLGATLLQMFVMEDRLRWKPVTTCLCPLCQAYRRTPR